MWTLQEPFFHVLEALKAVGGGLSCDSVASARGNDGLLLDDEGGGRGGLLKIPRGNIINPKSPLGPVRSSIDSWPSRS